MARQRGKHKERLGPFSPILYEELDSVAYQELSGGAAKAYPYFKRIDGKVKRKLGDDYNGIFDFTYSEAEKCGFARRTFSRAIDDLIEKGFLDIVKQGGKRGCGMSNSKYKLSSRWVDYGKPCFIRRPRFHSEPKG